MKIKETAARRKLPKGQKNLAFRDAFFATKKGRLTTFGY